MRNTQKTADDLRAEIDALSTAKNQHQAELEEEKKKIKETKNDLAKTIKETECATENKEKAKKEEEEAKTKLQKLIDEISRLESKRVNLIHVCKEQEKKFIDTGVSVRNQKIGLDKYKESIQQQVKAHKDDLCGLCDKIKGLL